MTIQDDKQYSLSGGQWKDLVARLSEGEIVQLTTDDYNYPTTEPNCIAPWLLPDGIYFATSEVAIRPDVNNPPSATQDSFIIRSGTRCFMAGPSNGGTFSGTYSNDGTLIAHSVSGGIGSELLNVNAINNNLTTTTTGHVLDARQGKVLKDLVDTKQDALTAGDNITIANNVISAAGGAKILTTADYDYPVNNPDRINVSNLAAGLYEIGESSVYVGGTNKRDQYHQGENFLIIWGWKSAYPSTAGYIIKGLGTRGSLFVATISGAGILNNFYEVITSDDVVDSLTSQASSLPLSAAQGKYLNDNKADKTAFTGTDGTTAGTMGLVPAPAAGDESKFLKADGTWATAGGSGPTVVQTTGTSTTDVMSQNAVTGMIYENPTTALNGSALKIGSDNTYAAPIYGSLAIGKRASAPGNGSIAINGYQSTDIGVSTSAAGEGSIIIGGAGGTSNGNDNILINHDHYGSALTINESSVIRIGRHRGGETYGIGSIVVGHGCEASGTRAVAIGGDAAGGTYNYGAHALANNSIALGYGSSASAKGEMNIGTRSNLGYSSSNYRLLTGLYDPQNDHDAATKGYVDGLVGNVESALNVINNGGSN